MACFLCLHNLPAVVSQDEDEEKEKAFNFGKVSLAAINYYLKLSENFQSNTNVDIEANGPEVLMCPECEIVASKLSHLCTQLEEIKLKINYFLDQFYGRLEEAEEEDNELEEKLLLLRNHYRNKCKRKLSYCRQPVIKIEKLKIVKVKLKKELELSVEETGSGNDDFALSDGSASEQQQFEENILEVKTTPMEADEENEWEDSSSSMSSISAPSSSAHPPPTKKRRYRDDVKGTYNCASCDLSFPSKWERRQHTQLHRNPRKLDKEKANFICTKCDNHQMFSEAIGLRRHNMVFHLELLFPNSKIDGITSEQYEEYCKHVLHVEGLISKLPNSLGYACQHCGEKEPFNAYFSLKKHLFRKHRDILGRKIEELQRTTRVEELKQAVLPPVSDNRKCEDCGAIFSQFGSLCRHLRQSCPFRRNKDVSTARPCECQDCGARYSGTAAFYNHRKKKHPNSTKDPIFI